MRVTAKLAALTGAATMLGIGFMPAPSYAAIPAPFNPHPQASSTAATVTPELVVVREGQYLDMIAQANHTTWQALAGWNHLSDPNMITPGEVLKLPPSSYVPPTSSYTTTKSTYATTHSFYDSGSNYSASGLAACIIGIESKGNPYIYNFSGSGAWGLYQFMPATYEYYARQIGLGGTFGSANAAEQTEVFNYAIAHGGRGNWAEC